MRKKRATSATNNTLLSSLLVLPWGLIKLGSLFKTLVLKLSFTTISLLIRISGVKTKKSNMLKFRKKGPVSGEITFNRKEGHLTVWQIIKLQPKIYVATIRQAAKTIRDVLIFCYRLFKKFIVFEKRLFLTLLKVILFPFKFLNPFRYIHFKKGRGRPRTQPYITYLKSKMHRFLNKIFPTPLRIAAVLIIFLGTFFFYSIYLINLAHDLPSPDKLSVSQSPLTTDIFDRNGTLLYRLYEGKNRQLIKVEQLPPYLIQATISIEDKNFYAHSGIDLFGITRAVATYFEKGQVQGGSTITQQLIKNTLLTPERTVERKVKEVLLAFWSERIFSKKEILQM
ncbi:transglycosylase domain-containing protein, partial [Candidatus Daviesbacteria bacterium]|nr:transglycosylase domain-containing protein [Candidatus Daviesbacteria bacterium]